MMNEKTTMNGRYFKTKYKRQKKIKNFFWETTKD